tara:strand:+ start:1447 stop:2211 length:765 start_codon:yes stop_codon:yes gene_type:complete
MKSPLKIPSKQFKALSVLKSIVPKNSYVHSFLFFNGDIELSLAIDDRFVVAHTNCYVIYEFWKCLEIDPARVANVVEHFSPIESKNIFHLLQDNWYKYADPFVRSGLFFLLNRYSDDGYISRGELSDEKFNPLATVSLQKMNFSNLFFKFDEDENFLTGIKQINDNCDYIFMPVGEFSLNFFEDGKSLGQEDTKVIHRKIKEEMARKENKIILLYRYTKAVKKFYRDYKKLYIDKWGKQTTNEEKASEVLIVNF